MLTVNDRTIRGGKLNLILISVDIPAELGDNVRFYQKLYFFGIQLPRLKNTYSYICCHILPKNWLNLSNRFRFAIKVVLDYNGYFLTHFSIRLTFLIIKWHYMKQHNETTLSSMQTYCASISYWQGKKRSLDSGSLGQSPCI